MSLAKQKVKRMKPVLEEAEKGLEALANDVKDDQKFNALWPEFIKWYRQADPLKPEDISEQEAIMFLWGAFLRGACIGIQQAIRNIHAAPVLLDKKARKV